MNKKLVIINIILAGILCLLIVGNVHYNKLSNESIITSDDYKFECKFEKKALDVHSGKEYVTRFETIWTDENYNIIDIIAEEERTFNNNSVYAELKDQLLADCKDGKYSYCEMDDDIAIMYVTLNEDFSGIYDSNIWVEDYMASLDGATCVRLINE